MNMTDLQRFQELFDAVEVNYVIRGNGEYKYLFIGEPNQAQYGGNFETTELEKLLVQNNYFEFENGELVSY